MQYYYLGKVIKLTAQQKKYIVEKEEIEDVVDQTDATWKNLLW